MHVLRRSTLLLFVVALTCAALGCGSKQPPGEGGTTSAIPPYTPGLGELMTLQQMRHTKLWLAGEAQNWQLAAYELDELKEGFDDVVRFHPTHKDSPVAPKDAIPRMMIGPLDDLGKAVEQRDSSAFGAAFDALTAGCNNCHEATNFSFNRVRRPDGNPFPNQVFAAIQ
jgi:hypothetical protein